MKFIRGNDRKQAVLFSTCLDDAVPRQSDVRLIDSFVNSLKITDLGFIIKQSAEGRPAYHPGDLLKLYIYGYLNGIRSSRKLERECYRNLEVIWLLAELKPDHNTIANFRRDNPEAIRKVFQSSVSMAAHFQLIGGTLLAGDSTKLRAQNSKKNNYNPKKIERHIEYIESKLKQYNEALATEDGDSPRAAELKQEIKKKKEQRKKYDSLKQTLEQSGLDQISTTDPDSRSLIVRNNIVEVAYNIQSTTDALHNLPIDYKVTNTNDSRAMSGMLRRASVILGKPETFTALYDKGYHTGKELQAAYTRNIEAIVAIPDLPSGSQAPDPAFNLSQFEYNPQKDHYTCPEGHLLTTNGRWYRKDQGKNTIQVKHYKTSACKTCPMLDLCTKNTKGRGRVIERSEYAPYLERNRRNIEEKEKLYRRRQAIVEHPFGTMKRQWGYNYILTKRGIKRASADVGLIFTAYNLRRIFNIIDFDRLIRPGKQWVVIFYRNLTPINQFSAPEPNPIFHLKIAA